MTAQVMVVDDDASLRRVTQAHLKRLGCEVNLAGSGHEAVAMLARTPHDLVIADLRMPGMSGIELLRAIRAEYPETLVIVITAYGSVETAVEAMKSGAYDYLTKPVHPDELRHCVQKALEHVQLVTEVRILRSSLDRKYGFERILGNSDGFLFLLDQASRAAQTDSTVLIHGETGTGKELLAKAIHFNSRRRDRPFVTINCGAIPKDLLESELFGHLKGSFTGAVAHKKGKMEVADSGTVFLDEIGELSPELQVKLLRLLQEGEIEKIGAEGPTKVDVRIVAATHRDLRAMIEDRTFRDDLYYRLSVIPLEIPPLRDRPEDIPELLDHCFARSKQRHGRESLVLPATLYPYFIAHRWLGNVRELENVVERLVVMARGDQITVADLPETMRRPPTTVGSIHLDLPPGGISLERLEKEVILAALERCQWNQSKAARYLDVGRKTLRYRMEKHGLRKPGAHADEQPGED